MKTTIRPETEMKDSGVQWLGNVPNNWNIKPLYACLDEINQKNSPVVTTNILSLTNTDGVIPYSERGNQGNKSKENFEEYKVVYPNTIVANSMNILIGSVGLSQYEGCVSPVYYVYAAKPQVDIRYMNYLFQMELFQKRLRQFANGILEIRLRVSSHDILHQKVAIPDYDEQQAIADYLDQTCSKIDEIIAEAKASIDEYKNFRQSVISEAVLNGIEQHNYKNVDLEWIASIPDTWGVMPLKRYFTYQKGLPITKADLLENGDKVISYGQIHAKFNTGVTVDERLIRYVSHEYSLSNSESLCSKGDIILADTSEDKDGCGNAVYIDKDEMIFAGYHTIILKSNVDNKYLAYLFTSNKWRSQIRKRVQGVKLFSVTLKILNQCSIILPPVNEQIDIVKYLDEKTAIIDACISEKESLINDLEAYKKSLIYEVVTGKRRVV